MKTNDVIWFSILGLGIYGAFQNIQWLTFIAVPLFAGIFIISTNRKQVDDGNSFYLKMSKRVPSLFPPSWLEKTSYKSQRIVTTLIGVLLVAFAIFNLFTLANIIK